ncbi:MAG: ferredoxin [Actinomycetota bacterium]
MKLLVDRDRCQGHGRCNSIAPELFDLDELGYSVVLCEAGQVPDQLSDRAIRAVGACPERAIRVEERVDEAV